MSITTEDNGRLCNQIIRNLSLSLLAKKYDLYAEYSNYDIINNKLGIELFIGKNKYKKNIKIVNNNYIDYLNNNKNNNANFNLMHDYFQTEEITTILQKKLIDEKEKIIEKNPYKDRYKNNNDLFIHIRLTDAKKWNVGLDYYLYCINLLKYDKIYIGTDDFNDEIVKKIKDLHPEIIFFKNNPTETIQFASTCKNIVLSHGSFSAIIGYLGFFSNIYFPDIDPPINLASNKPWCPLGMFINKGFNKVDLNLTKNNKKSKLQMFCVYHKKYYLREDNFNFIFFGVNEVYFKEKTPNNILEYELDKYNPFLQKRGYMETSAYLHIYWNKLYINKDMVGFSQYDMKHNQKYDDLDNKTIYLLNTNKPIVKNNKWDSMMFPKIRNLDFLIKNYNSHFKKPYTMKELENQPLSLWQTNIYPIKIYEKLCGWLEKLVDEIYPWSNQSPYETHFGSIGGYTERALSIFNAFEIYEGTPYSNLNIQHGVEAEVKEQYNHKSFLNNYSQDIHCKIVEDTDDTKNYYIAGNNIQKNTIIKKNINDITMLFYIDEERNKSKPLMIIGNSNDNTFKWKHNILDCNLDNYEILYKKIDYNIYNIIICKKQHITYKETIRHFVSKDLLKIPENKFSNELKQRWKNHEYKTNKKILKLIDDIDIKKKQYILDAGSHVGDTLFMISLYLKKKQLTNVKVIGIEPDKEKVSFIQDIIQLNHIVNIQLQCAAISDKKGYYSINKNNTNSGAWTIENCENGNDGAFVMLDDICKDKSMYLIHLDIEGYEVKALNSSKETIKTTPHIILEYEHIGLNKIKNIMPFCSNYEIIDDGDVYINNIDNIDLEHIVTEIDGIKFAVYKKDTHISKTLLNGNYWEKRLLDFMMKECSKYSSGIILDIGANIGSLSIPLAYKYPNLTVITLEADNLNCELIKKSKMLNNLNNLIIHNCCLSDKNGITMYGPNINFSVYGNYGGYLVSEKSNDPQIVQGTQLNGNKKWIDGSKEIGKSKTIDSFDFKKIIFMKLDVEGFENKILTGAINTIIKYKPTITAEYLNTETFRKFNFYKQMENIGYKIDNKLGNDIVFKCKNIINFANFTMVNKKHIAEIQEFVKYINKNNIEGAVVECGVWKGGIIMACIKAQQKYNEKREFYLYDTYEGMTEPNSDKDLKQDKKNFKIKKEWHKIDINEVKNNIKLCNYNKDKIHFIKGDVIKTLDDIIPEKISILRLDTDWYESTRKELEVLYKKVSNNGFVIIDDYNNKDNHGNPRGARVACNEFFPMISDEMKIIKPLSNEDNIPFCFQKIQNKKITCFSYSNNNKVYDITFPTIKAYCEEHNYQFIPYHTNLENKYKPHWNKIHYSIKLLKESNSEYIVWFDHDIVIKNYNIKLEDIITKYKFNQSKALFMMSQDPASHHPFNTGVIVFKNNEKTLNIFQEFLEMRNNPHKYQLLNKYGGFNFNQGMQDTRVMLAYFDKNKNNLLSIPHKVLQSFYGQAEFYSSGDLCGHVAGPQGDLLINKLKELKELKQ